MRRASSASLTWLALRSASEYTATVRTPSRRAVRITRHAISPRLAIRILPNTSVFSPPPGRLALLEERGDALLAFGRDADLGDAPGGVRDQRRVHGPPGDGADQLLDLDRKSTRLNSSHDQISYAVFCLKKKKKNNNKNNNKKKNKTKKKKKKKKKNT